MKGLEGIDYVCEGRTKTGARRRRKARAADIERTRQACARSREASDRLREARGLPPVPDNAFRVALRTRCG